MSEEIQEGGAGRESGRRLAAIVFADVAGYTELSSRDEDLALRVINAFQRVARRLMPEHGGRVVKFLGDGMLAEFQSLDSAVASSQALQTAFAMMEETDEAQVALRVGIHLGDVVFSDDGDVYGSGVNVASRIESHAPLSGIVVSDSAYRHLRNRKAYKFSSIGEHELKGVPDPMELYVVLLQDQQPSAPAVRVIQQGAAELPQQSPAWAFARWGFAVTLTLALAAYAADVPGVRGATVRLAGVVGLGGVVGPTLVEPPTYPAVEGGAVVDAPITLRFTNPIDPGTATRSSIQLYGPDDELVPILVRVEADGNEVRIEPEEPLRYESMYRIVISSLLRSATGRAVELPEADAPVQERLAFTTQPLPAGSPRLVGSVPVAGATDFPADGPLTFMFDQPLDPGSVSDVVATLVDATGRPVPARVECCGDAGTQLGLRPAEPLAAGTSYTVRLGRGLADTDREYFPGESLGFQVAAAPVRPAAPPTGPGRLTIRVVPGELAARTVVYLDGEQLGPAPIPARTVQESIRHRIEIFATAEFSRNRLSIYSDEILLNPGQERVVDAQVTPFGTVSVLSEPPGVVYIDGQEVGPTPLVSHLVTANRPHTLEIRPTGATAASHRSYTSEFSVGLLEDRGLGRIQLPAR